MEYQNHLCLRCNTNFVYYDGWYCKCETSESLQKIINDTLRALPVGNINTHTPDTIPERVQDWVRETAEECSLREKWEELADNLIFYAEEFKRSPHISNGLYEAVSKDIEQYEKLKQFTIGDRNEKN